MRTRILVLTIVSGILISAASVGALALATATAFRARRLYAAFTTRVARLTLALWGVRVRCHGQLPDASSQVVYVSNHSSTLDLFVLVAIGLPNTRFFLSGFLQRLIPLAILARLMGTFFTVPQDRPEARRRIFAGASVELARTRESVYLSPEGGRITNGLIGPFNKGAFHLATALSCPIVPLYIAIPERIDPGLGLDARPGIVEVFIHESIDTRSWLLEDVPVNRDRVRALFVGWHEAASAIRHDNANGYPHVPVSA